MTLAQQLLYITRLLFPFTCTTREIWKECISKIWVYSLMWGVSLEAPHKKSASTLMPPGVICFLCEHQILLSNRLCALCCCLAQVHWWGQPHLYENEQQTESTFPMEIPRQVEKRAQLRAAAVWNKGTVSMLGEKKHVSNGKSTART